MGLKVPLLTTTRTRSPSIRMERTHIAAPYPSRWRELMSTNEEIIRNLYQLAEVKDVPGFVKVFTEDGYFYDVSAGQKYYGQDIGKTVDIYARAFPGMHRELYSVYVSGDVVVVELSLNGTHKG